MPSISVRQLYLDNAKKLDLAWVVGASKAGNDISHSDQHPTLALVGHVNLIHPNRIQVFGQAEVQYLDTLSLESARIMLDQLFSLSMSAVIVANDESMPQLLRTYCAQRNVPLMTSPQTSPYLMDVLRLYLARVLAASVTLHGVFLDVLEIGVLITGESALGKSELALDLISRGHGLVADDAVDLYRIGPETLEARCPDMLKDFLEVRGLGDFERALGVWRNRRPPAQAAQTDYSSGQSHRPNHARAGPAKHSKRNPSHFGRSDSQSDHSCRGGTQPCSAGRNRRAQLYFAAERHRQHPRFYRTANPLFA